MNLLPLLKSEFQQHLSAIGLEHEVEKRWKDFVRENGIEEENLKLITMKVKQTYVVQIGTMYHALYHTEDNRFFVDNELMHVNKLTEVSEQAAARYIAGEAAITPVEYFRNEP